MKATVSFDAQDVHDAVTRALSYARVCDIAVAAVRANRNSTLAYSVTVEVESTIAEALALYERRIGGLITVTNFVAYEEW